MSVQYDIYLKEHRENLIKGYEWLKENLPEVLLNSNEIEHRIVFSHDLTKNGPAEYDAYDAYFYGNNRSYKVVNDFRLAWLNHIHNNPHHWQYWVLVNDDEKEGTIALEMYYPAVIEMICDWWSFSWKTGNLHEIFKWYEEHEKRMILHDNTRKIVVDILDKIKAKLDSSEN